VAGSTEGASVLFNIFSAIIRDHDNSPGKLRPCWKLGVWRCTQQDTNHITRWKRECSVK